MAKEGCGKGGNIKYWVTVLVIACIVAVAAASYYGIDPVVLLEYHEALTPQLFTDRDAEFTEAYDGATIDKGWHMLMLRPKGWLAVPVFLSVSDTTAPMAEAIPSIVIPLGETATPDQLVSNIRDNDVVGLRFETEPDFSTIGAHSVAIGIEDMSGNKTTVVCAYTVRGVEDGITIEAGSPLPDASQYLLPGLSVPTSEIVSEYTDDLTHHAGKHPVVFGFGTGEAYQEDISYLTVVDTVPPTGCGTFLMTEPGQEITPQTFVLDARDETDITFDYLVAPDLSVHEIQIVVVRMTDEGGNTADVESTLMASTIPSISIEARKEPLTPEDFGLGSNVRVEPFEPTAIGTYLVKVWFEGKEEASIVHITDATPPELSLRHVGTIYVHHPLQPEELFQAEDVFDVSMQYVTEPNWAETGDHRVTVSAVDANGNRSERTEIITIVEDKEPPVIYGVSHRNVYRGESVAYLAEVFAEDNADGRVDVVVDSKVVIGVRGRYLVTFTATDICGNSTVKKCYYTVVEPSVTEEELHALASSVIAQIITPDMVDAEKLHAVFYYVRERVKYTGSSNKSDWRREAVRGITQGTGDCFTVYAATRALLDEIGINYMSVQRQSSQTRHYWVIVNIGTGWYHFDPLYVRRLGFCCFMWTNRQCAIKSYYWRFDHAKYPEIATEPFDYEAVVAAEKAGLLP